MKKLVLVAAIAASTFGAVSTVSAQESEHTLTGNVSMVTDYRFRGVSQTDGELALQGGFDYGHSSGFYAGVWNSSIDFQPFFGLDAGGLETDVYLGYGGEVSGITYDVGLLQYLYTGADKTDNLDTLELYGSVGAYGFTLGAAYSLSKDYFGFTDADGSTYAYLNYDYSITDDLGLALHYGTTSVEGPGNGGADYDDYSIGLTYAYAGFDLGLTYVDTDIKPKAKNNTDGVVVLSVGKTF
ncbi:TorF family putative porin [Limnobacter alexandrii]|jgi:uncharacterized protein (TIGR02001 family)|uniref:TorF family putative porin n=1 Tax=Limnobacter alexandrii TaxID=2570352 RepID=UPI001108EEF3|nr:TorF family putative porin [Limnobacter alexandrii]